MRANINNFDGATDLFDEIIRKPLYVASSFIPPDLEMTEKTF